MMNHKSVWARSEIDQLGISITVRLEVREEETIDTRNLQRTVSDVYTKERVKQCASQSYIEICDDLQDYISAKYPGRFAEITISNNHGIGCQNFYLPQQYV